MQVASIVPSSKVLVKKVVGKFNLSEPRVIVEFGAGEGCHSREIVRRMHPDSRLLLFELDPELAEHLETQFAADSRVSVLHSDAQQVRNELHRRSLSHCDYILSGIPFSILEINKKRRLLQTVHDVLAPAPESAFVIYQVTNELRQYAAAFPRAESQYCLQNVPPMFITVFYKQALNGHAADSKRSNGSGH
jgi:phospholipid N-methyltransferase